MSANSELRRKLKLLCDANEWEAFIPAFEYCTDNAGMIGVAAHYQFLNGDFVDQSVYPLARMSF